MQLVDTKKVKSSSSRKVYKVRVYDDGTFWCPCPGFKFQKGKSARERMCKHTRLLVQMKLV